MFNYDFEEFFNLVESFAKKVIFWTAVFLLVVSLFLIKYQGH